MKKVAELDVKLTLEEMNLVSVGYRTVIGAKRDFGEHYLPSSTRNGPRKTRKMSRGLRITAKELKMRLLKSVMASCLSLTSTSCSPPIVYHCGIYRILLHIVSHPFAVNIVFVGFPFK